MLWVRLDGPAWRSGGERGDWERVAAELAGGALVVSSGG